MPFPTTRWSLLAQATLHGGAAERAALADFCGRYRGPVVAFIARARPGRGDAEDLAQGFFAQLCEDSLLQRANRARGRFRSFLIGAVLRHLAAEDARAAAAKRGGNEVVLAFDELADAATPTLPPEVLRDFDREWATDLMRRVRAAVQAGWAKHDAAAAGVLMEFLPGSARPPTYEEASAKLGWKPARLKTEVFRIREEFRQAVRAEVALTVDAPDEIDAELAHLHGVLASDPAA